ncbi:MAG: hypothetical protein KBS59_03910, partial [Clostridiales bacterium]|nr:hypothetical protein [Clostridiales bacterium]
EYGFIGGACGNISENEILFFGDIEKHPSCEQIRDFCQKHGVKIISGKGNLFDFGGFVCTDT